MAGRGRISILVAILSIVVGNGSVLPRSSYGDDRLKSVMGIVERVSGTEISVARRIYDIKGVPLRNAQGAGTVDASSLTGKTVEIVFRNGKVVSVTVYRTLPQ